MTAQTACELQPEIGMDEMDLNSPRQSFCAKDSR